jgi:hypothetical protein
MIADGPPFTADDYVVRSGARAILIALLMLAGWTGPGSSR